MSKVNIKGVILPESWFLDENVATLSQFQSELSECKDGIELYIDSPGGDVMTSNSMSAMLAEWVLNNPNKPCSCVIGGLCASAAANIVAKLPDCFNVSCYEDTLVMYHSCYGFVEGGPDKLRDNAVLMDLVNSLVINKLLSKTTLDADKVKNAFREGRELWLDGKQAVECGLVNEIKGAEADKSVMQAKYNDEISTEAYKYAACVCKAINSKMNKLKLEARMAEETKPVEETEEQAKAEVVSEAEVEKEEAKAELEEEEAKAETETEKEDIVEEVDEEKDDEPEVDWEAKAEDLKKECDALKAEVESLKALVAKYQPTAKPTQAQATKTDWLALVRELNAKHLPEAEYAKEYSALKKAHMDEFQAFMKNHTTR